MSSKSVELPSLDEVSFSLTQEAYSKIQSFVGNIQTTPAIKGTGALKYEGVKWGNEVFYGFCSQLNLETLKT